MTEAAYERDAVAHMEADARAAERPPTPIVPADSIAGRALVAVIAIMTFLGSLTLGAVFLVHGAAEEWQSAVAREVSIQVRPAAGRDIEAEVARAVATAREVPGIAEAIPYSREETARLLEPWLGKGLALDDLPVPRFIVVRLAPGANVDFARLRRLLAERVPGASLDDHRAWIDNMRSMARTVVAVGLIMLGLVLTAAMLSVTFAARAAMAANRPIIEVLHFVGARDGFIARQFQRHFLLLGLKGGAAGGIAALLVFLTAGIVGRYFPGNGAQEQMATLFGSFALGVQGYVAVAALILVVALVTAATARWTVRATLAVME